MGHKAECCICYMQRDNKDNTWSYPAPEERREYYVKHVREITHTYCPMCIPLVEKKIHQDLAEHNGLVMIIKNK